MPGYYLQILAPLAGLIMNVIFQALGYRCIKDSNLMKSVFVGYLAGLVSILIFEYFFALDYRVESKEIWFIIATNIITYSGLAFCYFGLIGLGFSLRIRILDIISRTPGGLSYADLADKFDSRGLYGKRLERLVKGGQIREENGRYYAGASVFMLLARSNAAVKRFMVGKASEFD